MNTSYFANLKNVRNPLSISGKAPDWYKGPQFKMLAPKWSFFKDYKDGKIDQDGYTEQYFKLVLDPLDPKTVFDHLTRTYGDDVTLLCYERRGEFCHRHLVAIWLEDNLCIKVTEL